MRENILKEKSFAFALRIIKLNQFLKANRKEYDLSKQVIRSGTAVGAMIREAEHSESLKDFIHKLSIALKEINETVYWIDLLFNSGIIDKNMYESINNDSQELLKLLISSVKTSKQRL